jgi:hypothetical protein
MNEQQIRDAGLRIDLPVESPSPVLLHYEATGQQTWTPPPGWRVGMPPIDSDLAHDLGVPTDLGIPADQAAPAGTDVSLDVEAKNSTPADPTTT